MAEVAAREMLVGYTETNLHSESSAALKLGPRDMVGSQSSKIFRVQLDEALSNLEASPGLSRRLD